MNSTWKSLLWKEWREQRWRLVALTLLASSLVLTILAFSSYLGVRARDPVEFYLGFSIMAIFFFAILAGTFTGMSVAGSENSHRTMRFLQALPRSMKEPAIAKLCVSIVSTLVPLLFMILCLYGFTIYLWGTASNIRMDLHPSEEGFVNFDQGINYWYSTHAISGSMAIVSILLWMIAGGVNRSDEVGAGAIGFLVCVSAWMFYALLYAWAVKYSPFSTEGLVYLVPALPGGLARNFLLNRNDYPQSSQFLFALIAILSHGAVLAWYLKRFGRVAVPPKRAGGFELNLFRWMKIKNAPMCTQWQAIAWKQIRETGPLAVLTVACILVIVPIVYFVSVKQGSQREFGDILGAVTLAAGFFVILVAGIGVFMEDFAPGVDNFWRSRPVNLGQWFVVKYVTGLSVLILAFGTLLLLAYWLQTGMAFEYDYKFIEATFFAAYTVIILFTLAMTSYCLLRQPIYAVVLTFGAFLCGMWTIDWLFPNPSHLGIVKAVMILMLATLTFIAYLAVKHDWGWKAER